jgi:hypothetical protein
VQLQAVGVPANGITFFGIPLSIVVSVTLIMQDTSRRSLTVNTVVAYVKITFVYIVVPTQAPFILTSTPIMEYAPPAQNKQMEAVSVTQDTVGVQSYTLSNVPAVGERGATSAVQIALTVLLWLQLEI